LEAWVKIQTTRFGELDVNKEDILNFSEGILGFESLKRFFIVDPGDSTLILWLQSLDDAKIAFPVIEPRIFKPDYVAKLMPIDITSLSLENMSSARVYSIITIPKNVVDMTANLKAPIVINSDAKIGKQIVLQDSKLPVQFAMYKELKKYIVNFTSDDSVRTTIKDPRVNEGVVQEDLKEQTNTEYREIEVTL